ncbi:MAG: prolyl-tRNA synthetase associated domain-containing protein [Chakrabartia sp.]
MSREHQMMASLADFGVAVAVHEHEAVYTVEGSAVLHAEIAGDHTKNLFLKDAGGAFWLVTAPHDKRVDLKALPAVMGSKKLSFGKAEDMERLLGVTPGSVTPLAAFNDQEAKVRVVLDRPLAVSGCMNVHPLRNTATLSIAGPDLIKFLAKHQHEVLVVDVPEPQ